MSSSIFPEKCELKGFSGPVRNQGERGTCAAFSTVALLEYFNNKAESLSPQYLYACCKLEPEKNDAEDSGTSITHAFECVKKYGMIPEVQWPYNKQQDGDEAQISRERLAEFKSEEFKNGELKMLISPRNIDEYKSILNGCGGKVPSPIVVGCRMYDNPVNNDFIEMPADFNECLGGHAMLIFGYQDAEHISGGGYFIAQNSWGSDRSSNNSGIIKIPYDYIRQEAGEAGYVFAVTEPDVIEVAAEETAKENAVHGEQHTAFEKLSDAEISKLSNAFFAGLGDNLRDEIACEIPDVNLPWYVFCIPWPIQARFLKFRELEVSQEDFVNYLRYRKNVFCSGNIGGGTKVMKVYELSMFRTVFRVAGFFFVPGIDEQNKLSTAEYVDILNDYYKHWQQMECLPDSCCDCMVYGMPQADDYVPEQSFRTMQVLCMPEQCRELYWNVKYISGNNCSRAYRHFLHSLSPESIETSYKRVKNTVDIFSSNGIAAIDNVSKELGMHKSLVARCFDLLQRKDAYLNYKIANNKICKPRKSGEQIPMFRTFFDKKDFPLFKMLTSLVFLIVMACLGVMVGIYLKHGAEAVTVKEIYNKLYYLMLTLAAHVLFCFVRIRYIRRMFDSQS